MQEDIAQRISDYLDANRERQIEFLAALVQTPADNPRATAQGTGT